MALGPSSTLRSFRAFVDIAKHRLWFESMYTSELTRAGWPRLSSMSFVDVAKLSSSSITQSVGPDQMALTSELTRAGLLSSFVDSTKKLSSFVVFAKLSSFVVVARLSL